MDQAPILNSKMLNSEDQILKKGNAQKKEIGIHPIAHPHSPFPKNYQVSKGGEGQKDQKVVTPPPVLYPPPHYQV